MYGIAKAHKSGDATSYDPEPFGYDLKDWPEIDRWLSNIENTPGWKHPYDLMPGSPADRA